MDNITYEYFQHFLLNSQRSMEKSQTPMVSRTREKLIEVARQLFAYKGVENTTMSDIASASDKGRRTVYTYFRSKLEIYEATIESDSDNIVSQLCAVIEQATTPADKLRRFLEHRLDFFKMQVPGSLGSSIEAVLHLDFNRIEKVRRLAIVKEKNILNDIIEEGKRNGDFDIQQATRFMPVIQLILQGVDLSIARDNFEIIDLDKEHYKEDTIEYIINSLLIKK